MLEFTYVHGVCKYGLGTAFGHIAIEVPDAAKTATKGGGTAAPIRARPVR